MSVLPPHPDAVLLDLDDTIVAWSDTLAPGWRWVADRLAQDSGNVEAETLYAMIGLERRLDPDGPEPEIVTRACTRLGVSTPPNLEEALSGLWQARMDALQPLCGAPEAVREIRRRPPKLGIVSTGNLATQSEKLERVGLANLFDAIVTSSAVGSFKSDDRIYRLALEELGVEPDRAWMVGDSLDWDVAVPQKMGMGAVWVVWPAGKFREMHLPADALPQNSDIIPDLIVKRLPELIRWL